MSPPTISSLPDWLLKLVTQFVRQQVEYLLCYEKNVEELKAGVAKLEEERNRVRDKAAEEQERYGRAIYDDVTEWLDKADEIISDHVKFEKEEDRDLARCSLGFAPNLGVRYRRSKTAEDMKGKVDEQLSTAKYDNISRWRGPPSMGLAFSDVDYHELDSRTKKMDEIMEALRESGARMIGVHGPTGVGKTTLVLKAANTALEQKLFDVVVMANVRRSPNIRKIQGQIADMLGMKLEEESEHARAARIQERLKREKESILVILDDLWGNVDLNLLGIPSQNGDGNQKNLRGGKSLAPGVARDKTEAKLPPGRGAVEAERTSDALSPEQQQGHDAMKTEMTSGALPPPSKLEGCKVLLISEVRQVLNQMKVEASLIFSVNVLNDKDAETLFENASGVGVKNSEFGDLAVQIIKKCNGLPMSIVTTAKALKNQSRSVWEDTLRKLERQKLTGTPEYSTKLSYELLEDDELRITFLLCARMGHDALATDLVKHCIGLGFLEGVYTVSEARDRVLTMLVKLKQSGLLSDSYSSDRFTMQNLVRKAALSIASKEKHVFTLTEGKLYEWPDEDKLKRYTVISLRHCDIIEGLNESIRCPRLRFFEVENKDPHLKISDNFFRQMKELRVLILAGIDLSSLPSSIGCLTKLRMLCLEQCMLGEGLCIIEKLKDLRVLSFSGSNIEHLPTELKHLSKLQIFDLSNCSKLGVIPPSVIPHLTCLEELYMRQTSIQWSFDEGQKSQSENASLLELGDLNQLTNLDIQISSVAHLPKNLFFDKLSNYKIVIGSLNKYLERDFKMPEKYELSRFLAIQQKDGFDIHSQKGIKMLFEKVEYLLLEKINGVRDIFYELNLKGFPYLKHLSIVSNYDIESLINPKDRKCPEKAFHKLESLDLYKLKDMKEICSSSCELLKPSFSKLKIIKIKLCDQLKNVFLSSVVGLLTALETIQVSECNLLEEIVYVENVSEVMLEFPELRSLMLQSLSKFIGFDPISLAEGTKILFHEKVVLSKIERMELSLIQIDQIWVDQSPHFQNLMHLDVNGCRNLKYLLSLSMARNLEKIQNLFISECEKMEQIFSQGQHRDAKMKQDVIFPNLKNIKLSSMKSLSEIWNPEVPVNSFGKLETLIIEECDKLDNVFGRYMVGMFRSLDSLRVTNCKSMKAIFDLADHSQDARYETKLEDVHLETLPRLKNILKWEKDQEGVLNLDYLQKIWVHDCDSLENIFPISVAKRLEKLAYLVISDCFELKEIVSEGEDANNNRSNPIIFEFRKLTTIKFSRLPKFKSFYPGAYEISYEALEDLSVEHCDKLEPFGEEAAYAPVREETVDAPIREETTDAQRKPILFPEKVINKLKSMQIELQHAKSSTRYRRDNLEVLQLSRLKNTEILYSFLHSNPNLESLWLNNCSFKELVPLETSPQIESLGVVPKLKNLKLTNLTYLEKIGFERDAILQRIELLLLKNCSWLDTIVHSKDKVSFTYLTNLEVVDCKRLKYLMPPSTAKSLVQLSTMKIINCESLEEIVTDQQVDEEEEEEKENAGKIDIIFKQLKALELLSLKNLKSFCSSKSCDFEFLSLEKFVVYACPKMEIFSQKAKSTPILQKIYVTREEEKKKWCWEGELQDTIQYIYKNKKFFEGMDIISISDHSELQQVWQDKEVLHEDWFYSLKTLKLEECKLESCAIPSHVLRCLKRLKELEVRDCKDITVIFEMNDTRLRGTSFQLKKLTLEKLPDVTHVWQQDKQGIPSFQNLQQVTVTGCKKLKALFPVALATDLNTLERLEVRSCDELTEIVEKEEGTEQFVFPDLTTLVLRELPQLTHFYAERFTLDCPELDTLHVTNCNKLELFQSQQEALIRQPLFLDIMAISKLETLALNWKDASVIRSWLGQPTAPDLQHLYVLRLFFDDDVNESSTFPFELLEKAPNLEIMSIIYSRSLEKIPFPSPEIGKELKRLSLSSLFELKSVGGLEHLSKLQQLHVYQCPRLMTLGQSFSNLKRLQMIECHGLQCLFTSSAAKMLIHLEEMTVWDCESVKEIVGDEEDETATHTEEIKFERLERIVLQFLDSLECFYSGIAALKFPSLTRVDIVECPRMKFFSQGLEPSRRIQVSYGNDNLVFHHDLNVAVKRQFLNQTRLVLGDYPELEETWLGRVPIPDDFSNCKLKYLEVEGCEFLSNAILPSHLLPLLSNLEGLVVRKCDSVEAIFDVKDTPTHDSNMTVIPLKRLILKQLPALRHVWNMDPKGSLSLPSLESVTINECKSIKSLFPASVPKDNLRDLDVRNCVELVEIVAKDEIAQEEANKEVIMFPRLTSLRLWDLPNLSCNCSGIQILDWPVLEDLDVYHCPMLKVFATDFQNSPNSYPNGQGRFTSDKHGFISAEKVTPHLEQLSLNKENVIMIEQGLLHVDLQKLKLLKLQYFNDESDTLPDVFFSKVPLPSIQEFAVADCAFKELFHSQKPDIDYTKILPQLEELELRSLHKLKSIGFEHPWVAPLPRNLRNLKVFNCGYLTNLAPSTVSFSNLTWLKVEDCARLEYLFTYLAAKSLVALSNLSIANCESLEKVVAQEEGDKPDKDVIFTKLTTLSLSKLPKLGSFHAGKSTLNFPCLRDVSITQCKRLEHLFTSSTAKSLVELREMSITNCESLETVVAGEEGDKPDEDVTFPKLWDLTLSELPKLRSFYTGKSTLNFPWLYDVSFTQCKSMETFSHGDVVPKILKGKIDGVRWYGDLNTAVRQQFGKGSSPELA